jgi:hypothetical protein
MSLLLYEKFKNQTKLMSKSLFSFDKKKQRNLIAVFDSIHVCKVCGFYMFNSMKDLVAPTELDAFDLNCFTIPLPEEKHPLYLNYY